VYSKKSNAPKEGEVAARPAPQLPLPAQGRRMGLQMHFSYLAGMNLDVVPTVQNPRESITRTDLDISNWKRRRRIDLWETVDIVRHIRSKGYV